MNLLEFARLTNEEKILFYLKASDQLGISTQMIEKDFWVTFLLHILFSDTELGEILTFKGGTSLSKCYEITNRFSEDIDLTINKDALGFSKDNLPNSNLSVNQQKKILDTLRSTAANFVNNMILPKLSSLISAELKEKNWKLELDSADPEQLTILFHYPSENLETKYILPQVKLEFGARGEQWPVEARPLTSYIEKALPGQITSPGTPIKVLTPERTIWEKATILHAIASEEEPRTLRQSRHFYDLYCLSLTAYWGDTINNISLLRDVCEHKMIYFRSLKSRYEDVLNGTIRLIPHEKTLKLLEIDYEKMTEMIFGNLFDWALMIDRLREIELKVNQRLKNE